MMNNLVMHVLQRPVNIHVLILLEDLAALRVQLLIRLEVQELDLHVGLLLEVHFD